MLTAEVLEVYSEDVSTTEGTFTFGSLLEEGDFQSGDTLTIAVDQQRPGYETVENLRTGKKYSFPLLKPAES